MFDWDVIHRRREMSSLCLWGAACSRQTLIVTSACVSRVIGADEHVQRACTSNNRGYEAVFAAHTCVCPLACTHTALLLRLLNYEAFGAVVMAPSAFGNMSFYFCLGPNIQFEKGSQTIHDLFKRAAGGGWVFPARSRTWQIEVDVKFLFFRGSRWWLRGGCVRWWVCFVCCLPAGERLSTGVPWSGAARVHDLQPREVREPKSSRPSITRAKSRGFCFFIQCSQN